MLLKKVHFYPYVDIHIRTYVHMYVGTWKIKYHSKLSSTSFIALLPPLFGLHLSIFSKSALNWVRSDYCFVAFIFYNANFECHVTMRFAYSYMSVLYSVYLVWQTLLFMCSLHLPALLDIFLYYTAMLFWVWFSVQFTIGHYTHTLICCFLCFVDFRLSERSSRLYGLKRKCFF